MEDKRRARVEPAGWERSVGGGRHVPGMEAGTVHVATRNEVKAGVSDPGLRGAGPAAGIIQVSVWKEEVSRAAHLPTGQA